MGIVCKYVGSIAALLLFIVYCDGYVRRNVEIFSEPETTCGYESCHKVYPDKINVHLVPHTHDDVGWLKTVDEYYYGLRNDIQKAEVRRILNSVVDALLANPERRFIYVETAFFWKWWMEQTAERQHQVKALVSQGRLEFIGGAWSMNDEATTHYDAIIDQFTWALRKLNDTFGSCGRPHVGWQIDPFGHSREMASILARMGYDGLFFARLHYTDKYDRLKNKTMELIWRGSPNLGEAADLFTGVLYDHYSAPWGFCFDILCNTEDIDKYNAHEKVEEFLQRVGEYSYYYTTNHVMFTMGDDFNYQDAHRYFENLDKVVEYVNLANKSVNVIYSTPSCYMKAVNDAGLTYSTKQDDFLPYASTSRQWWTGFYTSRPTLKYFERLANNFLQIAKQLVAMTQLGQDGPSALDDLRQAMGVLQHHDAVSGTERQHVAEDYASTLHSAMEKARAATQLALNQLISKHDKSDVKMLSCLRLNVSSCDVTEKLHRFVVTVYNPLSHDITHFVRLPVPRGTYKVQGPDGVPLLTQMLPIPKEVLDAPERENSIATHELVFKAEKLPPLGFRSYYVTKVSSWLNPIRRDYGSFIGKDLEVLLNETTGLVRAVRVAGREIPLVQTFSYYSSASSGAYLFNCEHRSDFDTANVTIYKGNIVDEIHQTFSPSASQVVRVYHGENNVEFEWLMGPLPDWYRGSEVVSRFSTELQSNGIFHTDSNCRELLQRERRVRDHVEGNYYPITSRIVVRDPIEGLEIAVLNDRAQGGTSFKDGEIELMLHRRLQYDDGMGLGQNLDETAYGIGLLARGRHYVTVGPTSGPSPNLAAQQREIAQRNLLMPWLFLSPGVATYTNWRNNYNMEYYGLKTNLPQNVKILTLEPWRNKTLLLRLEHIFEKDEDNVLSNPVNISYKDIFTAFTVSSSHETTLSANQWTEDAKKLKWKYNTQSSQNKQPEEGKLQPMEIKTYVINVDRRSK